MKYETFYEQSLCSMFQSLSFKIMTELSQSTKELISKYEFWKKSLKPKEGVSVIHVDEVASKVASFYEQIRTIIDWKEEHLMRRAAIIRKLKRRFLDLEAKKLSAENIAESLVLELIRGGYFPNDKIEESKIGDVQKITAKHIFIFEHFPKSKKNGAKARFYDRLLEIAACEIEESLAPSLKEMALIDFMFSKMRERIKINESVYEEGILKKEEKDTQIYIAVQQALFKLDEPIIGYNLLKYKYPYWDNPAQEDLLKISQNICKILDGIASDINHPLGKKFYALCEKYDTPYLLLGDILASDGLEKTSQEIRDPALFESKIRNGYLKRLADLKRKIRRAAVYSTLSIFLTKILTLVVLEIILAKITKGHSSFALLSADVIVPTLLMAVLVATARPPSSKNLNLAVMETIKIAYEKAEKDSYEIKIAKKRTVATRIMLSLIYLAGACLSFGFIFAAFYLFKFPLPSIVINIIFIALILFAGMAIRKRAQELTIEQKSMGVVGFIADILFLPVTDLGRWISEKWKRYNAVVVLLNVLIDMPFSAFVEFLERWRYFLKEKKEDLRQ